RASSYPYPTMVLPWGPAVGALPEGPEGHLQQPGEPYLRCDRAEPGASQDAVAAKEGRRVGEVQALQAELSLHAARDLGVLGERHVVVGPGGAADPGVRARRVPEGERLGERVGVRVDIVVEPVEGVAGRVRVDTGQVRALHAAEGAA